MTEEPQLNQILHRAISVAFQAGRQAERDYIRKALDLNASGGKIYLEDFEDALRELDAERQEKKLP